MRHEMQRSGSKHLHPTVRFRIEPGTDTGAAPADTGQTHVAGVNPDLLDLSLFRGHTHVSQRVPPATFHGRSQFDETLREICTGCAERATHRVKR